MPNRRLTQEELVESNKLLATVRDTMKLLSKGDSELLFAYRRKVYKELSYDERSKPATRKRLKQLKIKQQSGKCMECQAPLPFNNAVLDRFVAAVGYVSENTRLICPGCDQKIQRERAFK